MEGLRYQALAALGKSLMAVYCGGCIYLYDPRKSQIAIEYAIATKRIDQTAMCFGFMGAI